MAIPDQKRWQTILHNQQLANANRWLKLIDKQHDPTSLITKDYDNFLRALETTLKNMETFDLSFRLIQAVYFTALDFADWDRWLSYLNKALAMSQELGLKSERATLLVQKGDIYHRLADLEQAKSLFKEASEIYNLQKNQKGFAGTLSRLAILYAQQGNTKKGIDLCQQSLFIGDTLGDGWVTAQACLNMSLIHLRARNWNDGLQTAQQAYDFYKEQDSPKFTTKALVNIVAIWAELGNWEEVDSVSEQLLKYFDKSGDIRTLSQLKNNLGVVAFNQENFHAAEAFWQEALGFHSQIQEPVEMANLYNNLGVVYTKLEEWETAESMLFKAISAHKKLDDIYNWANSLDNLADLYEVQGKMAVCQQVLEKALAGLKTIPESPHVKDLISSISHRLASFPPP